MTLMSSREFNQDTGKAKKLAEKEPVFITDRGAPSHVLLSIDEYTKLASRGRSLSDMLSMKSDVDIDFEPPKLADSFVQPIEFD
jgi:prevent-host-death family protein